MKVKATKASQTIKKVIDDNGTERVLSVEWQEDNGKDAAIFFNGVIVTDAAIVNQLLKEFLDRCPMAFETPEPGDK